MKDTLRSFMALLLLGKHLHKFRVVGKQFV